MRYRPTNTNENTTNDAGETPLHPSGAYVVLADETDEQRNNTLWTVESHHSREGTDGWMAVCQPVTPPRLNTGRALSRDYPENALTPAADHDGPLFLWDGNRNTNPLRLLRGGEETECAVCGATTAIESVLHDGMEAVVNCIVCGKEHGSTC